MESRTRILVPVDGSRQSENALKHALSTYDDADFVVIHVIDPVERRWSAADPHAETPLPIEDWCEEAEKNATEIFSEAQTIADDYGETLTTETSFGYPADKIVDYTREHDIDHVIIGAHSKSRDDILLLGSVAEAVTQRAECPVTVMR